MGRLSLRRLWCDQFCGDRLTTRHASFLATIVNNVKKSYQGRTTVALMGVVQLRLECMTSDQLQLSRVSVALSSIG